MKANYHTHCDYCDGIADPETVVRNALDKGFDVLGFSSHSPLNGESWTLDASEVKDYARRIRSLADKYKDKILILLGMERDFIATEELWTPRQWEDQKLDYMIGSVHMLWCGPLEQLVSVDGPEGEVVELIEKGFGGDPRKMVEAYYDTVALMAERECFDFLGHLDVVKKRNKALGFLNEDEPWYLKKVISVLDVLQKKKHFMEINTGGIFRGATDSLYPSQPILKECRKRDIPIVINSDSHDPLHLDGGFDLAREAALDAGYTSRMVLDRSGWRSIPL